MSSSFPPMLSTQCRIVESSMMKVFERRQLHGPIFHLFFLCCWRMSSEWLWTVQRSR